MLLQLFRNLVSLQKKTTHVQRQNEAAIELWQRGELTAASATLNKLIHDDPSFAPAYGNLGMILAQQNQFDEALTILKKAAELAPNNAMIQANLAALFHRGRALEPAIKHYEIALKLNPEVPEPFANLLRAYMDVCEWDKLAALCQILLAQINQADVQKWSQRLTPFGAQLLPLSATIHRQLTDLHVQRLMQQATPLTRITKPQPMITSARLKVGYLSPDFRGHAVAYQCSRLFELHDRTRFDVFAYSYGPNDGSLYRHRVEQESDTFRDITVLSFQQAAQSIADDGIDILIDLAGHTGDGRPEILAFRPAPLQLHYLGYPGSVGKPLVDALIADAITVPPEHESRYSERILRMPHSFFMCDDEQVIAPLTTSRKEQQLPEKGFVFCCFSIPAKIETTVFSAWMRILKQVAGSTLWLGPMSERAKNNLRRRADDGGVDANRLVFADRIRERSDYLARFQLADMFLDTFLYNAHAVAADALWAELPVLTLRGEHFASRVAASLLNAAGVGDLIATDMHEYEEKAISLGLRSEEIAALKRRLHQNKFTSPLFQTARFVREFEDLLLDAWRRKST